MIWLTLAAAAAPYVVSDEQFAPYRACVMASVRLLVADGSGDAIWDKAESNCLMERQSIVLDAIGADMEKRPGGGGKPDLTELYRREADLRKGVLGCLAAPKLPGNFQC